MFLVTGTLRLSLSLRFIALEEHRNISATQDAGTQFGFRELCPLTLVGEVEEDTHADPGNHAPARSLTDVGGGTRNKQQHDAHHGCKRTHDAAEQALGLIFYVRAAEQNSTSSKTGEQVADTGSTELMSTIQTITERPAKGVSSTMAMVNRIAL